MTDADRAKFVRRRLSWYLDYGLGRPAEPPDYPQKQQIGPLSKSSDYDSRDIQTVRNTIREIWSSGQTEQVAQTHVVCSDKRRYPAVVSQISWPQSIKTENKPESQISCNALNWPVTCLDDCAD